MLSIQTLALRNVGRIAELDLRLSPGLNLVCGPNGIGKTTILECIGDAFSQTIQSLVRKRVDSEKAEYVLTAQAGAQTLKLTSEVKFFDPHHEAWTQGAGDWERWVITLKTNRAFEYLKLDALQQDPGAADRHRRLGSTGIAFGDIKNWFVNRYLFSTHRDHLTVQQIANLDLAKRSFTELDPTVCFSKVIPASFDLMVRTPDGEIYFEYLSSGFKSCLCLVLGIIKEIEYRFGTPYVSAADFAGVVLIDELDLHLHPEWQPKLVHLIKKTFPKAQFIGATHSPHMIQAAAPNEIIALEANPEGRIVRRELPAGDYGFQGWTVEEILTDVMGMPDTRSTKYRELEREFDAALGQNNRARAEEVFSVMDRFLHPNNVQRKLFKLQLGHMEAEGA